MRAKSSISYDKEGNVKKMTLQIYPEHLTLKFPSEHGLLYLLDAIEKEMIKDCKRKRKEQKKRT